MQTGQEFVDYYAVLKVDPSCDAAMLEKAFRHFAQMYHPDHAKTADTGKFQIVVEAYNVLKNPNKRAKYDRVHANNRKADGVQFTPGETISIDQKSALMDAEIQERILYQLYNRRREHADQPGIIGYYIQKQIDCSDENFEFHTWYLKAKGYIETTENSELAITLAGVDHVISMSRKAEAERLLLAKLDNQEG